MKLLTNNLQHLYRQALPIANELYEVKHSHFSFISHGHIKVRIRNKLKDPYDRAVYKVACIHHDFKEDTEYFSVIKPETFEATYNIIHVLPIGFVSALDSPYGSISPSTHGTINLEVEVGISWVIIEIGSTVSSVHYLKDLYGPSESIELSPHGYLDWLDFLEASFKKLKTFTKTLT